MNFTALLIIDVQRGLFTKKTSVYNEQSLLENITLLIERAHSNCVPVFYIQQSTKNSLAKGSDNWQLHPSLHPSKDDIFINKRYASAFKKTDLKIRLNERKITRVVIMGIATHQCVRATCLDAKKWGLDVILVKDGHSSYSKNAAELIDEWNNKLSIENIKLVETKRLEFDKS